MKQLFIMAAFAVILSTSCKKENNTISSDGDVTISFDAKVGNADFVLNQNTVIGERTYNFKGFRYWVSNIVLVKADGSEYAVPASYYLMEETNAVSVQDGTFTYPAKKREDIILKDIPRGDYKQIKFSIGIDAKHNDNLSLQAGELSQLSGMTNISWMWHTSYIFTSIQGTVNEGTVTRNFKAETGLNANYKTISVSLAQPLKIGSSSLAKMAFDVDVAKLLDAVDLITTPVVGASQAATMATIATNFATKVVTVKTGTL